MYSWWQPGERSEFKILEPSPKGGVKLVVPRTVGLLSRFIEPTSASDGFSYACNVYPGSTGSEAKVHETKRPNPLRHVTHEDWAQVCGDWFDALGHAAWRNEMLRHFCISRIQLDVSGIGLNAESSCFGLSVDVASILSFYFYHDEMVALRVRLEQNGAVRRITLQ